MATYADADDVKTLWPRDTLSPEEVALVEKRLNQAERKIRRRIRDLDAKVTSGELDEEDIQEVLCEAVLRVVRNPEGYVQESDGNYSYMLSTANTGKLYITDEEWESLGVRVKGLRVIVPKIVMPR